jgi:altronate hydrolase
MIIHPLDNVEVREDGHKYAIRPIAAGENVIKYGMPIGHAKVRIDPGEHVHTHNLASNLAGLLEYTYQPDFTPLEIKTTRTFAGFLRPDGQAGVRNDLWVIPTVGCVNALARRLADAVGGIALTHPYGCSQLGGDHECTANLLAAFAHHPNAGGVLVVGLGCENNTLDSFRERLGDISKLNIRFLRAQDDGDEYARGLELLAELDAARVKDRTDIPVSALRVGLKCGGSDGLSGLTANPLVGRFSDWLAAQGGTTVLTEVPEMFGAETLLMNRCISREVFDKCVAMINGFKSYYERHGQPIDENPSPGNKAGGISTLEDKSLGCVQKGGSSPVVDVLEYGQRLKTPGLNLLAGPGNDLVASSVLAAAGCQLVLFTTGRGTPFGTVVPTVKVATNTRLAQSKPHWIDWDAQGQPDTASFVEFVLKVASGESITRNEKNDAREIAIFKDGVTL